MKQLLLSFSVFLLLGLLAGCSSNGNHQVQQEPTPCSNIFTLHKDGEPVMVNKQEIMLVEKHGESSYISFNHELEQVNGLTKGSGEVFDESFEEVDQLLNCIN